MKIVRVLFLATIMLLTTVNANDFKPDVKVKGKLFLHLLGDLSDTPKLKYDGFNVYRTYLTVLGSVSPSVSTRLTLDLNPKEVKYKYAYVKYAYAEYRLKGGNIGINVGQQATHWVGFVEKAWKYRSIQKVLPDYNGVLSSADLGIGLTCKLPSKMGKVIAMVTNGNGYKNDAGEEEDNFQKDISARLTLTPLQKNEMLKKLALSVGFQNKNVEGDDDRVISGLISYTYSIVSVGVEVLNVMDDASADQFGFSVFGDIAFSASGALKNTGLLFRYDSHDPDNNATNDGVTLLIVGPRVKISKHTLAIVFEQHGHEDSTLDPTNLLKGVLIAKF